MQSVPQLPCEVRKTRLPSPARGVLPPSHTLGQGSPVVHLTYRELKRRNLIEAKAPHKVLVKRGWDKDHKDHGTFPTRQHALDYIKTKLKGTKPKIWSIRIEPA
jgi:hypothetical protein